MDDDEDAEDGVEDDEPVDEEESEELLVDPVEVVVDEVLVDGLVALLDERESVL